MQYITKINGVDFAPYIRENGVTQSETVRNKRSIVTLDGILHQGQITKRVVTVRLLELRGGKLAELMAALGDVAEVEYTDFTGAELKKTFYVGGKSAGVKTVRGGNTYWSGATFNLEEK